MDCNISAVLIYWYIILQITVPYYLREFSFCVISPVNFCMLYWLLSDKNKKKGLNYEYTKDYTARS